MEQAFSAYENVRHRLPSARSDGMCLARANLADIMDEFDTFFLDAFGVLNIGDTAIAGVPARVAALQKAGKRVLVVSNAAGYPHSFLMNKYQKLGYDFADEDVITSRKTLLNGLKSEPDCHMGIMANEQLGRADLEGLNITFLGDDPTAYDNVDAFLMIGSAVWTEDRQAMFEASVAANPRPVYVGNPDIVAPRENGFSTEPGAFAHRLADRTGVSPQFFGKPFGTIFDLAIARLNTFDPVRTLMVGDSLHTDILGGQCAGIKTALIADYGFFVGADVNQYIEKSGIYPDYILERP